MPLEGDLHGGEAPLGLPPLGLLPRGDRLCSNSSSAWGSGTEAKRAGAKTCVGCRKAPPRPLTMRCSGSKGCKLAVGEGVRVPFVTALLLAACAARHNWDQQEACRLPLSSMSQVALLRHSRTMRSAVTGQMQCCTSDCQKQGRMQQALCLHAVQGKLAATRGVQTCMQREEPMKAAPLCTKLARSW